MKPHTYFEETQRFKQWWLWLILIAINTGLLVTLYSHYYLEKPVGDPPLTDWGVLLLSIFILLLSALFISFTLHTRITNKGIEIRFAPLHKEYRCYTWEEINKAYCRTYNPIMEYGGWGIRFGLFGKGMAYNISGNQGLQIELKNKKKILIGTQKSKAIEEVLNRIESLKEKV